MSQKAERIKRLILWPKIRSIIIQREHKKCAKLCRSLINSYYTSDTTLELKPKQEIKGKIIWQYWDQGFDDNKMPEIVKISLDSVKIHCSTTEYTIIRLSDSTISDYIDLPSYVIKNKDNYSKAFFSDILRLCLLTVYGGCWLDTTIFLSGKIPQRYWEYDYFLYQRDDNETDKQYWEQAYAYYYGWQKNFKVRMLSSIMFSKKNNTLLTGLRNILLTFWESGQESPNYFLLQILYNELISDRYSSECCPIESDCKPHYLQQYINDPHFNIASKDEIFKLTTLHKLTYKYGDATVAITDIIKL